MMKTDTENRLEFAKSIIIAVKNEIEPFCGLEGKDYEDIANGLANVVFSINSLAAKIRKQRREGK